MHDGSATRLRDTLVELAAVLSTDHDVGDVLQFVVHRCAALLRADTAGVFLEGDDGTTALGAATSRTMLEIEDLEITLGQGPSQEAFRTGEQILVEDLDGSHDRWPLVTPRILELGLRSVCAFPLRHGDDCVGALNLYRIEPGPFAPEDVQLGQALAEIAAVGIFSQRAALHAEQRAVHLQRALDSRVLIEQAKGMLAERHGGSLADAYALVRDHARNHNLALHEVCRRVVEGELEL